MRHFNSKKEATNAKFKSITHPLHKEKERWIIESICRSLAQDSSMVRELHPNNPACSRMSLRDQGCDYAIVELTPNVVEIWRHESEVNLIGTDFGY